MSDFASRVGGDEEKEGILMMLGLKEDTHLPTLESFEHPLGVIKITRKKPGLAIRLEERNNQQNPNETLQAGAVLWGTSSNE